jgi:hypothetical protein
MIFPLVFVWFMAMTAIALTPSPSGLSAGLNFTPARCLAPSPDKVHIKPTGLDMPMV